MCLHGFVVGVLPDDDDLYFVERTTVEGIEDEACWRIDGLCLVRLPHKGGQEFEVGFVEFGLQYLAPSRFDAYLHSSVGLEGLKIRDYWGYGGAIELPRGVRAIAWWIIRRRSR